MKPLMYIPRINSCPVIPLLTIFSFSILGCFLYNQFFNIFSTKIESHNQTCDIFTGKWIQDNVTHPLYREDQCEYLTEWVTCLRNGRQDSLFQNWRWQPTDCFLPKFDARLFLGKIRGKRLMFVGDSIHRNQWESLVCMVQSVIQNKSMNHVSKGYAYFKAEDYNVTLEFYWAPYLVESNVDVPPMSYTDLKPIVKPESIYKHGKNWKGVDYLVFNTYMWWTAYSNMTFISTDHDEIDVYAAFEKVLKTLVKWIEENVDFSVTTVFFSSLSPTHIRSLDWDDPDAKNCAKETTPIANMTKHLEFGRNNRLFTLTETVIKSTKLPIHFLNITALSEYRKDAHTTFYSALQRNVSSADPKIADCIHWCLPGLPDTWNELLYAKII